VTSTKAGGLFGVRGAARGAYLKGWLLSFLLHEGRYVVGQCLAFWELKMAGQELFRGDAFA